MLRHLRNALRLVTTARTLARYDALFPLGMVPILQPLERLTRRLVTRNADDPPGVRLARALQALGPAFIKLGQSLATRGDLLGAAIARDLSTLQDRLPPFPAVEARIIVERELEQPIAVLFATFEAEPVAAASIAQVHFATTPEGAEVAVKILRPGIERAIERDIDFILWLAELAERLHPPLRRYKLSQSVQVIARSTRREMDLRLEAAAAAQFALNNADAEGFRIPTVDWHRTARRVATFERVAGLRIDERDQLVAAGLDPDSILERAAVVFFNQVFRDGFFHADMHPGNMLVDPRNGDIVALDFGIMGQLAMADRRNLAQILQGFLARDYALVADVFFRAGFLPPDQDRAAFTLACRALGEPILGLPLDQISFGRLLGQLLLTAESFEMETRSDLVLLQKTILVAEGVGRGLNPRVNIWQLAQPLVVDWIATNLGPQARLKELVAETVSSAERLPVVLRLLEQRLAAAPAPAAPTGRLIGVLPIALALAIGLVIGLALG